MSRIAGPLAVLVVLAANALAADVSFTAGPSAVRDGDKVKISFAVSAATDVEVAIIDAGGRVVRHLAAGVLGDNPPAPLSKGLKQELVWDGRDDAGSAVDAGAVRVRVSAGLSADYAGTAFGPGEKPGKLTNVIGLASGPDGRVYVLSEPWVRAWWRSTAMHVFKPSGEYDKTIKPFPGGTPAGKVAALTGLADDRGAAIPIIYRVLAMSYYPQEDVAQQFAVADDGNVHFLTQKSCYWKDREGEKWLASIAADGTPAYPAYSGGQIDGQTGPNDPYLAVASDGKSVFATGLAAGKGDKTTRPNLPAVYRIDLPDRKEAKVFFGDPAKPGADEKSLGDPRGIATDGKGKLYIADRANDRVLIVSEKDGALLKSVQVKSPAWIGVSRKLDNCFFVVTGDELAKFAQGSSTAQDASFVELGRTKLPALTGRETESIRRYFAMSDSADGRIALWVGASRGPNALVRCESQGGGFSEWKQAGYEPAATYWNIAAGLDGRTVAVKTGGVLRILDESTGKSRDINVGGNGETFRLGPNNEIYGLINGGNALRRMDANGKSLPFAACKASGGRLPVNSSGTTSWERDFDIDRAGNVYVKQSGKAYHGRMTVDKYDKDGNKLGTVIWVLSDGAYGPRLDAAGNIYIADAVKPAGKDVPDFFRGKIPDAPCDSKGTVLGQYQWMYGSVMKFTPAGGAIWFPRNIDVDLYPFEGEPRLPANQTKVKVDIPSNGGGSRVTIYPAEVQGAEWIRYGCSYVLDMHVSHNRRCHCTATEIDVDDFGRTVYTDQGRFRVVMLDAAGNEIMTFGRYGNQDYADKGPDIGFNWFTGLGVTDSSIYVADGCNHRVVRAALKHAASQTCQIK